MAENITVKRLVTLNEPCEIFTFRTETDRQSFIKDRLKEDPVLSYSTNMDPDIDEPDRFLLAIPEGNS